ncbi:DUF4283 domain-containing protein/zf-CCHC_4 domain-containing protein [Cephalotus follicularis]|uniref:DUF4283 domain-containing protein/zf-CCHC_4 domain-containing protein n=1 Tax=Cephalotus follicularis TaxID=3775 RepID=A0A1Q3DEU5_CEPFO|nr:DUF4283 domain-containing protein/zf-CCHC_4 domain-containing protein [Cephalotus follicularis]
MFGATHLAVRKWSKDMVMALEDCKSIPIWVKLTRIPVQYWTKLGLSYITSVLGKPIHMDANTTKRYALSFASVCIDMEATSSFPDNIVLKLDDGTTTNIGVEYPWRPASCTLCKVFDHSNKTCPKAARREWMPKQMMLAQRKPDDVEGWITVKRKGSNQDQAQEHNCLEVPPLGEELGPGKEVMKQAPITPVKKPPGVLAHNTFAAVGDAPGGVEGTEDSGRRLGESPRIILPGGPSGHKKKKKKGREGLEVYRSSK